MVNYAVFFIFCALVALIWPHSKRYAAISATAIFLFIGLRWNVGMDWNNYAAIVERDSEKPFLELVLKPEGGFGLLVWLSQWLGGIIFLNIIASFVFSAGLFRLVARFKEPSLGLVAALPYLAIAVAMSATRQSIALGIAFLLIAQWNTSSIFRKTFWIIFASTFHFSALFLLLYMVTALRGSLLSRSFAYFLVGLILLLVISATPDQLGYYDRTYYRGDLVVGSPGALSHVALVAFPGMIYLITRRKWALGPSLDAVMLVQAIASLIALPALLVSSTGVDRISLYLWPMALFVYGGLPLMSSSSKRVQIVRISVALVSIAIGLIWLGASNSGRAWIPYRTILSVDH